jgi:putative glutathione S-transferase
MGVLIDGKWTDGELPQETGPDGQFRRAESAFRGRVTADGSSGFKAEPGRYHLYVAHACPWAHRVLIVRALKKLEELISVAYAVPGPRPYGWAFEDNPAYPDCTPDRVNGFRFLHEAYTATDPRYTGKVTVPTLWDTKTGRIVSNESAEIIRMFNAAFDGIGARPGDFYPEALRGGIDALNERIYATVNNGVYKAGFATTQAAYEEAVGPLFETLDWLEGRLATRRYLCSDPITEADWRLFTTLVRFDPVYVGHFKCNIRRLVDYPNLWAYTRDLYQVPGVARTVDLGHIKRHYYESHRIINPSGIVPAGPEIDFAAPHSRASAAA